MTGNVAVAASSSNTALVSSGSLLLSGTGANRSITVTPDGKTLYITARTGLYRMPLGIAGVRP